MDEPAAEAPGQSNTPTTSRPLRSNPKVEPGSTADTRDRLVSYDPFHRVGKVRRGSPEVDQVSFDYVGQKTTAHRRVWGVTGPASCGEQAADTELIRDGFGRLAKVIEPAPNGTRTTTYTYDSLDRLTAEFTAHEGRSPQ